MIHDMFILQRQQGKRSFTSLKAADRHDFSFNVMAVTEIFFKPYLTPWKLPAVSPVYRSAFQASGERSGNQAVIHE